MIRRPPGSSASRSVHLARASSARVSDAGHAKMEPSGAMMMEMHDGCINTDELVAMITGGLPPGRVDAIVQHVDVCAACAEVVANLGHLDGDVPDMGRYQLGHVLGAGAMGIVYEAWDPQLHRK